MAPANKRLLILFCCLLAGTLTAQSNIRAWYAKGQVWIIWNTRQPLPQTFAIYKSNRAFTQIKNAAAIGRLFPDEYFPDSFIRQTGDSQFVYKIPKPDGGIYELQQGEALFVETPVNSGKAFYGVVEWGDDNFVSGQNATALPVEYTIDPVHDPVSCHLQYRKSLNTGHRTSWYALWLLGSQNENKGRPDYPVMANAYKNGMPAMFIVSESPEMDTSDGRKIPGTLLLHDEDGMAAQYLPDRIPQVDIKPVKGISIAHQDELYGLMNENGEARIRSMGTAWFGYAGNYDPFIPGYTPRPDDVLINYTQRRILWINKWLNRTYQMDPDRVAVQGLGTGACGAVALGKCFPTDFSTICAFHYGSCIWNNEAMAVLQGSVEENLPTKLLKNKKETIRIHKILDLNTQISTFRDFPLLRIWVGENDEDKRKSWGAGLGKQLIAADSIGMGMQIQWDEGSPSMDQLGTHWIKGVLPDQQTYLDNLSTQENHGSKQSYPAFFNHRLDPNNPDPGNGLSGENNDKGDP
ncbi:MAG TPA: hypothetical protein VFX48_00655, partial [Saprospiraceae bacterium]|nr:hypothetical protein [Saprospiraceae bacterium]